ncbi:signal peptidase I [Lactococcus formosensis]|uniref:signal peptidase I n=1 Tax=Lactococcus formosensis TaxID=1281486 RepID=UPI001BCE6457|nr:signal peptidase I [Lactococcus formosensis]
MIKLYRGESRKEAEEICLFMLDSFGPSQVLQELMKKQGRLYDDFDVSLLNKKYYFTLQNTDLASNFSTFPVLNFLEELESVFPQIIWTKIMKSPLHRYKVEFIPVSFYNHRQGEEDGVLADCLEEMGYHASNLIPTFRMKVEEVFNKYKRNLSYEFHPSFDKQVKKNEEDEVLESDIKEKDTDIILQRLRSLQEKVKKTSSEQVSDQDKEQLSYQKNKNKHEKRKEKKKRPRLKMMCLAGGIVTFIVLLLFVLLQFYGIRTIEGNSMKPLLNDKAIIVLEKHPSTLKRQDIIAFNVPQMANKEFVKRIIALPGDTVYATQGKLYVNNRLSSTNYTEPVTEDFTLKEISGRETVPEGKLFVLGDNRSHSTDSRNYGFVDQKEVKGKVLIK